MSENDGVILLTAVVFSAVGYLLATILTRYDTQLHLIRKNAQSIGLCPHCGCDKVNILHNGKFYVECCACKAKAEGDTEREALEFWECRYEEA